MVLDHRAGQQKNACKAAFYAAQRFKSRSFFKCCFCHYMLDMCNITTMVYVPIRTTGRLQFHTPAAGNTHPPKYPDAVTERAQMTPSFFWVGFGWVCMPRRQAQSLHSTFTWGAISPPPWGGLGGKITEVGALLAESIEFPRENTAGVWRGAG